jgi:Transcriptional regulatory protein, C terminal
MVRFNVLGPVTVVADDGTDVTPRGAQQRRLLTALLAAAPDTVPASTLGEVLWPAETPTANALQSQVSKLRRALAGAEIAAERGGYALVPGPDDRVDFVEFERLARAGRPPTRIDTATLRPPSRQPCNWSTAHHSTTSPTANTDGPRRRGSPRSSPVREPPGWSRSWRPDGSPRRSRRWRNSSPRNHSTSTGGRC